MKTNTYGMKMTGLKKASGETKNYGYYSDKYVELFYDRGTGEVWTVFQCSLGHNFWTQYHDPEIIKICNASEHMTMQQIADAIHQKVTEIEYWTKYEKACATC